mgnify:CR=1 FL=1
MKAVLFACAATTALILAAPAQAADLPALRLNQSGYEAGGPIGMTLAAEDEGALAWRVLDAAGATRAEGRTHPFGLDAASGERVHQIEVAPLPEGDYSLIVGDRRRDGQLRCHRGRRRGVGPRRGRRSRGRARAAGSDPPGLCSDAGRARRRPC